MKRFAAASSSFAARAGRALGAPRWPTASLRAYFVLVIVVATVPLALFSFHLVAQQAALARAQTAEAVQRVGGAFALLVEQELMSSIDLLTGLAYNDALQRGDAPAFHRQLQRGMPGRASWRGVYLAQPSGRIVFASDQPYGSQLGRLRDGVALERIRSTLQPTVTDLVRVAATGEIVTGVQVPVVVRGRLEYVLGARIAASHWQQLAERAGVPAGGFVSLIDREARLIAHSRTPGRVGEVLPLDQQALPAADDRAPWPSLGLLDMPPFVHHRAVAGSGWTAGAGVPSAPLLGTQAGTLASMLAAGALSLLLGVVLAVTVASRVTQPLRRLARGDALCEPVVVREIAALASALQAAGEQNALASEAMERAQHAAEQANRGKDEFLAMLGHELRNPLGAIAAAAEVLNRTQGQGDIAANARRVIERQTRHMAQLMNDLQDVARAGAGKLALDSRRLDLAQLVWRPLEALRLAGRFRHHTVTVDVHPAWVHADPIRMEQVVANLLTNAAKYTPADGSITLWVRTQGDAAVLSIADNGMGIADNVLPHVFDLFVQGERATDKRQAGIGLGLALVRRLVELHGGTVHAASEGQDRGSTFTVRLPAQPADAAAPPRPWRERHAVIVAPAEQAPLETASLLGDAGCRVTLVADVRAGLECVARTRPDLVLVDLVLPGALDLSRDARAAGASAAIVGVTDDVAPTGAECFDAVMQRPVDMQALLDLADARRMRAVSA